MNTLVLDAAYPVTAAQSNRSLQQSRLGEHFTPRPGTVKRAALLCKQGQPVAALSLIYARMTASRRVKQFQTWSKTRVKDYPMPSAAASAEQLRADIQALRTTVTSGISKEAHDDTFRMVVQRYCHKVATTEQLVALRRALGSPTEADADPAWSTVASALDDELAKRVLVAPLKEIHAQLERPGDDARALDRAFMRLAAGLQRLDDQAVGHRSLVWALHHLTDTEVRTIARQVFDGPAHGSVSAAQRLVNRLASAPASASHRLASPDLIQRRTALLDVLRGSLREHLEGRLDHFVRATSLSIPRHSARGVTPQSAYQAASASLASILRSLRYDDISDDFAPERLVPRLMPYMLAAPEAAVTPEFLCALDDATFVNVQRTLSADRGRAAWPALQTACDRKLAPLQADLGKAMGQLQSHVAAGDRGAASVQIVNVAKSLKALHERAEALCINLDVKQRQEFQRNLDQACRIFRHVSNHEGPLDQQSIAILSNDEIRNLRSGSRYLESFGLSLSQSVLEAEALRRSAHHQDKGIKSLMAFVSASASLDIDQMVHTLRDAVEAGTAAIEIMQATLDVGADEVGAIAQKWGQQVVASPAGRRVQAAMAFSAYEELYQRFTDVFNALVAISSEADDPAGPDNLPVRHISDMVVLSRYLVSSLDQEFHRAAISEGAASVKGRKGGGRQVKRTVSVEDPQVKRIISEGGRRVMRAVSAEDGHTTGMASIAERRVTPVMDSALLRSAIAREFGVDYDPDADTASLLLAPAQYEYLTASLAEPIVLDPAKTDWVETPKGRITVDTQFLIDAKRGATFSVSGVSPDGKFIPYTAATPGQSDRIAALKPVFGALQEMAGKDAASLTAYVAQTAFAGWVNTTAHFGEDGPLKLTGGRAARVSGAGDPDVHVTRRADGRYLLRMAIRTEVGTKIAAYRPNGDLELFEVDGDRSFYAITFSLALSFDSHGGHTAEVVQPPALRYRVTERTQVKTDVTLAQANVAPIEADVTSVKASVASARSNVTSAKNKVTQTKADGPPVKPGMKRRLRVRPTNTPPKPTAVLSGTDVVRR